MANKKNQLFYFEKGLKFIKFTFWRNMEFLFFIKFWCIFSWIYCAEYFWCYGISFISLSLMYSFLDKLDRKGPTSARFQNLNFYIFLINDLMVHNFFLPLAILFWKVAKILKYCIFGPYKCTYILYIYTEFFFIQISIFFFLWIDVDIFWKDVYIFPPSLNVSEIDSNESDQ